MLVYLSLGANLNQREQTISRAIDMLSTQSGSVLRRSSFYYSEPWGFTSPHEFCNCCVALETELSPLELLHSTQAIERQLGRCHKTQDRAYSDRTIDIDLICAFNQQGEEIIISSPELTLPHPLREQRDFVRIPLQSIYE